MAVEAVDACGKLAVSAPALRKSLFQRHLSPAGPFENLYSRERMHLENYLLQGFIRVTSVCEMGSIYPSPRGVTPMAAASPTRPKFVHRSNRDGTVDSICRGCFMTVATSRRETDLEQAERKHCCDPWTVERFKKIATPEVGHEVLHWRASA